MSNWISLPSEILFCIFNLFESKLAYTPYFLSMKDVSLSTSDILELQLTCKSWYPVSRSILYRRVALQRASDLDRFITTASNSGIGALVENIYIDFVVDSPKFLDSRVTSIALQFPNLKLLSVNDFNSARICELIEKGRRDGFFTKLQVFPLLTCRLYNDINRAKYNSAAFQLRKTLREVKIYDRGAVLAAGRLSSFPNIDTVHFDFAIYDNLYTIDQQMKNHSSIKNVNIIYEDCWIDTVFEGTDPEADVFVSSQIDRLCVTSSLYTRRLYTYIIRVFPNLKDIILIRTITDVDSVFLPVSEAVELFHYLMKKRFSKAKFHISDTQADFMLRVYDQSNKVRNLSIRYKSNTTVVEGSSSLEMEINDSRNGANLVITTSVSEHSLLTLPRTYWIQKSGFNLLYLYIDMSLFYGYSTFLGSIENEMNQKDSNSSLSEILNYCPNLLDFTIRGTCLFDFGEAGLQLEQRKRVYKKVTFENVAFGPVFLASLSLYVSYIHDMYIVGGFFSDSDLCMPSRFNCIDIDMPDTTFDRIRLVNPDRRDGFYLKLLKKGKNRPVCYYGESGRLEICSSSWTPPSSLNGHSLLYISIKCTNIRSIDIGTCSFQHCFDF